MRTMGKQAVRALELGGLRDLLERLRLVAGRLLRNLVRGGQVLLVGEVLGHVPGILARRGLALACVQINQ